MYLVAAVCAVSGTFTFFYDVIDEAEPSFSVT